MTTIMVDNNSTIPSSNNGTETMMAIPDEHCDSTTKEALQALLESLDVLSKLASLDHSVYVRTLVANSSSDGGTSATATGDSDSKENDSKDNRNASMLQYRLDTIQKQWKLEHTPILHINQCIHKFHSNMTQLIHENNKQQNDYDVLNTKYKDATKQIKKLERCVTKLHNSNSKLKKKLKIKRNERTSIVKSVKEYISSAKKEKQKSIDLSIEEQRIAQQLKAHEQLLKLQRTFDINDALDDFGSNNDTPIAGEGSIFNRGRASTFDTFDSCGSFGGGGGGVGNRSRGSTLDSVCDSSAFDELLIQQQEGGGGAMISDGIIDSEDTMSIDESTSVRSVSSLITDDGVPSVRFAVASSDNNNTATDEDHNKHSPPLSPISTDYLASLSQKKLPEYHDNDDGDDNDNDNGDNNNNNNNNSDKKSNKKGTNSRSNNPWAPLRAAFTSTKDKFLHSSPEPLQRLSFPSNTAIGLQFIRVPLEEKSSNNKAPPPSPSPRITDDMLHSTENQQQQQQQEKPSLHTPSNKTADPSRSSSRNNDDADGNMNTSDHVKKELSSFRFAKSFFNKGTSSSAAAADRDDTSSGNVNGTCGENGNSNDNDNGPYAFLVCGYKGFDTALNVRPTLGTRLISFNGTSLEDGYKYKCMNEIMNEALNISSSSSSSSNEVDGMTTTATATTTIPSSPSSIVLKFRNESLTKKQRELLDKAVKKATTEEEGDENKSSSKEQQQLPQDEENSQQKQDTQQPQQDIRGNEVDTKKEESGYHDNSNELARDINDDDNNNSNDTCVLSNIEGGSNDQKANNNIDNGDGDDDNVSQQSNSSSVVSTSESISSNTTTNDENKGPTITTTSPLPGTPPGEKLQRKMKSMSKKFKSFF